MRDDRRRHERRLLAAIFIGAGVLHLVRPQMYLGIMPAWVPAHLPLVYLSGVAEIAGGAGLLRPAWRGRAGWWLVVLLIAVLPANVEMLRQGLERGASLLALTVLSLRLPLQGVLIWRVRRVSAPTY